MRLNRLLGCTRTEVEKDVVVRVQILVQKGGRATCSIEAMVWTEHVANEVLCKITRVEKSISIEAVCRYHLLDGTAVVGLGLLIES